MKQLLSTLLLFSVPLLASELNPWCEVEAKFNKFCPKEQRETRQKSHYGNFYTLSTKAVSAGKPIIFDQTQLAKGFVLNSDGTILADTDLPSHAVYKITFFIGATSSGEIIIHSHSLALEVNGTRIAAATHTEQPGTEIYSQALVTLRPGDVISVVNSATIGILTFVPTSDPNNVTASIIIEQVN